MFNRLYSWYGKRVVLSVVALIIILVGISIFLLVNHKTTTAPLTEQKAVVSVKEVKDLVFASSFSTVGTVEAVSEATLQTETGGRVINVTTEIGKFVTAGTVLATIENSAQKAQLLQAEGAYDAAVAGAVSSGVSVDSAESGLETAYVSAMDTYRSTFITIDSVFHNDIDNLFNVTNSTAKGFALDGKGTAPTLVAERNNLENILNNWAQNKSVVNKSNILQNLTQTRLDTQKVITFVDTLSSLVTQQDTTNSFTEADKTAYESMLYADRVALSQALQAEEGARTSIESALKAVEQSKIAGSDNQSSVASAQIKIALGTLRGAQANYEKTLVRTPISGVVNALYLKTGDYVSPSQKAAIIANNNGLQIRTSVNETDSATLHIGDKVTIDKTSSGVITAIAPALDPTTSKVAVNISVDDGSTLTNGSTVSLEFKKSNADVTEATLLRIPLESLKITTSGPIAFEVKEDGTLSALKVTVGAISGNSVLVVSGLQLNSKIVTDARGLKEGQSVSVK